MSAVRSTEVAPMLTADAARLLTDEVKEDAAALWSKLLRLYERGAHTALGYSSWGSYYRAEFGGGTSGAYRLLEAAKVCELLTDSPIGEQTLPASESVARELVPVLRDEPERVEEVWAEAVEEHGPEPTAKQVREVVRGSNSTPSSKAATPLCPTCGQPLRMRKEEV